jgi:hypothetical protein
VLLPGICQRNIRRQIAHQREVLVVNIEGIAIRRWTTAVLHPDELGWLREALALNAEGEDPDDDEDE